MPKPTQAEVDAALENARQLERRTLSSHRQAVSRLLFDGYRTCWHCGEVILQGDTECEHCGVRQRPMLATGLPAPRMPSWTWGCTLAIVGLIVCTAAALLWVQLPH